MILLWLLPIAALLHIGEEFVFPGDFASWYRGYRVSLAPSFTSSYLVTVNVILVALCLLPLIVGSPANIALWLSMASVVFFNALFHIRAVWTTRRYSPGALTSLTLYVPLAVYGYWHFLSTGETSWEQGLASAAVGVAYWGFSSANHRRRAGKSASAPL